MLENAGLPYETITTADEFRENLAFAHKLQRLQIDERLNKEPSLSIMSLYPRPKKPLPDQENPQRSTSKFGKMFPEYNEFPIDELTPRISEDKYLNKNPFVRPKGLILEHLDKSPIDPIEVYLKGKPINPEELRSPFDKYRDSDRPKDPILKYLGKTPINECITPSISENENPFNPINEHETPRLSEDIDPFKPIDKYRDWRKE